MGERAHASTLSEVSIRSACDADTRAALDKLEVFAEIESTNSWLLGASAPAPGRARAAVADYQSAGRGRHGKRWELPRGAGLCLSVSWTFRDAPGGLAALPLALGCCTVDALATLGIADAKIKWPNDIVLNDGKLAGILVEVAHAGAAARTVVAGIGMNIQLPADFGASIGRTVELPPVGLSEACAISVLPGRNAIAGLLLSAFVRGCIAFSTGGLQAFHSRWRESDYLCGRLVEAEHAGKIVRGTAMGISADGELLVDASGGAAPPLPIRSGSVSLVAAEAKRAPA